MAREPKAAGPWGARPPETSAAVFRRHSENLSLLRINAENYVEAKSALKASAKKIAPGSLIIFERYMGFPGWENGPFKAWQEAGRPYKYLARNGAAVLVEVTG